MAYWQLLDNGSVVNGALTLSSTGVTNYKSQAALALGETFTGTLTTGSNQVAALSSTTGLHVGQVISGDGIPPGTTVQSIDISTNTVTLSANATISGSENVIAEATPTDARVQTFAKDQYQSYVTFFNQNLAANWMSEPEFQANDSSFNYVATSQQVSNLESNATWTTAELMNPVAQVALDPAAGTPVGILTPNISGANVTLVTGGSVGHTSTAATAISQADVQSWNLTTSQESAIANATAPGDVVVTSTGGVEVTQDSQVFISATGDLNATATGSVTIQGTSPDLTLNNVTAGGAVNITAQESILGSGTGTQITTPGNTVLKAGTGTLGSPSKPLIVSVGGQLHPYAPPGNSYLSVNGLTAVPATLNAVEGQPLSSTVASHIVVANFDAPASITDPSNFTATIDWGDGTPGEAGVIAYDATAQDFAVWASTDHVYSGTGVYNVAVTIDDLSAGASIVAGSTAVIQAAELESDPRAPGSLLLAVGGTTGSSDIVFGAVPGTGAIVVTLNGTALGTFHPTSRTLIFGQSGNDQFEVDAPLTVPVFVNATLGTNSLTVVGDGANDAFTVTSNLVTVASPLSGNTPVPIAPQNIHSVTINGGMGDDVFTIAGTALGTTTSVNTGTGADTVNVEATAGPTTVNLGGSNASVVNVGSLAPATGGIIDNVQGNLTVVGNGDDTMNVDDTGSTAAKTGTLNATTLTGLNTGASGITYSGLANLTVSLGSGGNTFTVANTAGGTSTTVNSGNGTDTVNVTATSSPLTVNTQTGPGTVNVQAIGAAASINAGGGNDTINVSSSAPANTGTLAGIAALLTVNGGSGTSTANFSDTGDGLSTISTLNGTGLTSTAFGTGGSLSYSLLAKLNIDLGSGGNVFTVANTGIGTTTTVNSGTGSDTVNVQAIGGPTSVNTGGGSTANVVNVGSLEPATGGLIDNIQGALTVIGDGGDTMNVDDTGSTIAKTGTLTASALTGLNMVPSGIAYSGLANLNIGLGSGGNTFLISNTAAGTTTFLNSGTGADTVNVQATSSTTTVNTGGGSNHNIVNVASLEPMTGGIVDNVQGALTVVGNSADTMNVDDTGSTMSKTGSLTASALTGLNMGPSGIAYSGLANLNISLGSGGNTFLISNTAAGTTTFLNSGTGADTVNVHATSGTTTVNTGGGSNHNIVNVASLEPMTGGIVDNVQGALTVVGNSADTMNVDDTGSTMSKTGSLTASALTGLNMGPSGIAYSGLANLNISLGSGGNTFLISNTAAGTTTTLNSGTGTDTVNVQATGGPTTLNTGGGSNTNFVNVGSLEPTSGGIVGHIQGTLAVIGDSHDTMNVDDTSDTASHAATLTPTTLTGLGMGPSGIAYSGLASLSISLGSGGATGNTFAINAPAGQNLPATTLITGGSAGRDVLAANWATDFNGTLGLSNFATSTITVGHNLNGSMSDSNPGTITSITIGGSLTASGALHVVSHSDPANPTTATGLLGDIGTMTVGGSIAGLVQVSGNITTLNVGPANTPTAGGVNDVSGQVNVGGALSTASISGNLSGASRRR